jgi:arylsulfatase A-like enzyme
MVKAKGIIFLTLVIILMALSCSGPESDQPILTAEVPLHLEEHLDAARIIGSEVPEEIPAPVEWHFDEPQPNWSPVEPLVSSIKPVQVKNTEDALRLILTEGNRNYWSLVGGIYIDLSDWDIDDWGYVLVTARARENVHSIRLCFNLVEQVGKQAKLENPQRLGFMANGDDAIVINDGSVHSYLLRADWSRQEWEGPWKQLIIYITALVPTNIDILSVTVIPKEHIYAGVSTGVSTGVRNDAYRQTRFISVNSDYRRILYVHTPGQIEYRVRIPQAGRLDFGLGVLRKADPVIFRIKAKSKSSESVTLFKETYTDKEHWAQRSVDLSSMSKQVVTLALEVDSERGSTVALWSAPTLTGTRSTKKPNVIFYIIDGAGADYMSVYGYNRRTTPNLERLAAEGAVFEYAYSNSSWTKPSNMSFMTSLHCSVLGGFYSRTDPLPEQAVTMAQHMHRAGYQTAVLVNNPHAAQLSGLGRDVDWLREATVSDSASSVELHQYFWAWREAYPAQPYWVHFQTTDVHDPNRSVAPFAGLYVDPKLRESFFEWDRRVWNVARAGSTVAIHLPIAVEKAGVDRLEYFHAALGLYAETMAHQDYQIGKLVEQLKAKGEWENTLLIIASDHGREAGAGPLLDPLPPDWFPILNRHTSRIPLIFIWPGHIQGGQRFTDPVSMIDVLPTILDLVGLPMPDVMQGQSLAPLLLGKEGWEQRPVIFDEFLVELETKELYGWIEMIDGRWGVSMEITPDPGSKFSWWTWDFVFGRGRPNQVLLYDIWNDPYTLHSLHEEHPDLVKKYTEILKKKWREHRELGKLFTRSSELPLNPEQLETLRSLGYIR